jgi:hypothetical protein
MDTRTHRLARTLRCQEALITRRQALGHGLSAPEIHGLLNRGIWRRFHRNVYGATSAPTTPRQRLLAACLACGDAAVASHGSAGWLWDLTERPPDEPEVTVATSWIPQLKGVRVHRSRDLDPTRTVRRGGIPTTDPLRTVVDLAATLSASDLADVLDRGLASRLITLPGVVAELNRLSRHGRPGLARLRQVIAERGPAGAPHPSVLESRTLRLLVAHGLPVPGIEVVAGPDGEYRLDFADPLIKLAIEVDGYVWHFTPEQVRRDNERRNRLTSDGWHMLVFTWVDITRHPDRVAAQIRAMRQRLGAA